MAADEQSTPPDPKVHQDSEEQHLQAQASVSADDAPRAPRYIAGIGASAGGLDALKALLQAMPTDTGVGFVVVTHMDPRRDSILPELLQRHTDLKVVRAEDNCAIAADTGPQKSRGDDPPGYKGCDNVMISTIQVSYGNQTGT